MIIDTENHINEDCTIFKHEDSVESSSIHFKPKNIINSLKKTNLVNYSVNLHHK
jgi:hypothetical protein